MIDYRLQSVSRNHSFNGYGLVNSIINKLPFELHLPSYNFCGPGTKLKERLARGDRGINKLDEACREHDIAYSEETKLSDRHKADNILVEKAWQRVKAKDSSITERLNSLLVTNLMKAKTKLGMGVKSNSRKIRKRNSFGKCKKDNLFRKAIKEARNAIKSPLTEDPNGISLTALNAIKNVIKNKRKHVAIPRIIPLPKVGGFLPLLPIFAGLSALGALSGGAAGISKAINDSKVAQQQLEENKRHNLALEGIKIKHGAPRIKKLIEMLPNRALTNIDIDKFGKMHINNFRGVYMRDTLPSKSFINECGVINLDINSGPGTHWVAYNKNQNAVEYFDSFGNLKPPVEVVKYLGKHIQYNYKNYQNYNTFICGHMCLKFLIEQSNK